MQSILSAGRLTYSIDETAATIGVSRSTIYRMLNGKMIEAVRICGRRRITAEAIETLLSPTARMSR